MNEYHTNSPEETEAVAEAFARTLKAGDVVAYRGGLGAGKTAFTRGLAKGIGVSGDVSSPTFSLVHEYQGEPPLYHFDMYRISGMEDLYSTGFFDYLDSGGILAVEWSENIAEYLPDHTVFVELCIEGETGRAIRIFSGKDGPQESGNQNHENLSN